MVRRLVRASDVVIENFRPGALERWNLGWDVLKAENPKLILVRISGYGQTGPYKSRPGFAAIAEAFGGLRYVTGFPDRPPVRPNLSIGDTLASLHGVIGALLALHHLKNGGQGQVIDVALYESVFNVMESLLPEYDAQGASARALRQRAARHRAVEPLPLPRRQLRADRRQRGQPLPRLMTAIGRDGPARRSRPRAQ